MAGAWAASNYFRYVRDPWGSYAEYSYDIDFVAPGAQWPAADYPPEDPLYVWGPAVPKDFVPNHELNGRRGGWPDRRIRTARGAPHGQRAAAHGALPVPDWR